MRFTLHWFFGIVDEEDNSKKKEFRYNSINSMTLSFSFINELNELVIKVY